MSIMGISLREQETRRSVVVDMDGINRGQVLAHQNQIKSNISSSRDCNEIIQWKEYSWRS